MSINSGFTQPFHTYQISLLHPEDFIPHLYLQSHSARSESITLWRNKAKRAYTPDSIMGGGGAVAGGMENKDHSLSSSIALRS